MVRSKRVAQIDVETGEVLDGFTVCVFTGKNAFRRWVAVSQEAFGLLGRNRPQASECWVFFLLLEKLGIGNDVWVSQKDIAADLRVAPETVSRALKKLGELGVILKEKGRYQINPSICWRGKGSEHRKEMRRVTKVKEGGQNNGKRGNAKRKTAQTPSECPGVDSSFTVLK